MNFHVQYAGILDFKSVYDFVSGFVPAGMGWIAFTVAAVVLALIVINVLVMSTALYTWFERRVLGRFQNRLGPNRWGPFGLLQPFADILKLIMKEDTTPEEADRWVMTLAPIALLVPTLIVAAVIPFGPDSFLGRLNIGILFVLGVTSVNTIAIFMAGWGSANKYAMLGAMRGVAMLVSYEVPMALGVVGVLIMSGSLALFDIVEAQTVPFLLVQPLGFLIFVAAASAEMSRTPFDQIEAESELGSGYNTEYSGIKFALLFLAEFMAPIINALVITTLFLGGNARIRPRSRAGLVRPQDLRRRVRASVGKGNVAEAEGRPDNGVCVEGTVCSITGEHLRGGHRGGRPAGRNRYNCHRAAVGDGGDQLGDSDNRNRADRKGAWSEESRAEDSNPVAARKHVRGG